MSYCDDNCMESEVKGTPVRDPLTGAKFGTLWECRVCSRAWYANDAKARWYVRFWRWCCAPITHD